MTPAPPNASVPEFPPLTAVRLQREPRQVQVPQRRRDLHAPQSVEHTRWHLAAVRGELTHHFLVQPDVHRRAVVHAASVPQLLRQ